VQETAETPCAKERHGEAREPGTGTEAARRQSTRKHAESTNRKPEEPKNRRTENRKTEEKPLTAIIAAERGKKKSTEEAPREHEHAARTHESYDRLEDDAKPRRSSSEEALPA
jgi:hypothetical protein